MLIIGNLDPDGYFRMPAVEGEADDSAVARPAGAGGLRGRAWASSSPSTC